MIPGDYVPNQDTAQFTDLVQLVGDKPLIGRTEKKPTVREDGNIDFTNVLDKSGEYLGVQILYGIYKNQCKFENSFTSKIAVLPVILSLSMWFRLQYSNAVI